MLDPTNFAEGPVFILMGKSALDVSPDVLPADTVPFIIAGGSWGGTWVNLGFTDESGIVHGGLAPDMNPQNVSQQRGAASIIRGNSSQTVAAMLLEFTAANFKAALGGGTLTSTATSDRVELTDSGQVEFVAIGVEGFGPKGKPLRIVYPIVAPSISDSITQAIGSNAVIPATWTRSGGPDGNPVWAFLK